MKNFLSLLCILSFCIGCDKAYDLNKIESGDVTIGNDQSEWIMPLAQITVGMDELQDGSADIRAIFDEVDIWLPTTLPGNAEWVDIVRLSSDGTYLDGMLEALIDEMLVPGSKKMDEVVDLIWSNEGYRERFTALIPADSEELFKAELLNSTCKCNRILINNLFKFFVWREVSKSFTRSIIEFIFNPLNLFVGYFTKVLTLWDILPDKPVGVFIGTTFP